MPNILKIALNRVANNVFMPILLLTLFTSSCATHWEIVSENNKTLKWKGLYITVPNSWMYYNGDANNYVALIKKEYRDIRVNRKLLTKNGFNLDMIEFIQFERSKAMPSTSKLAIHHKSLPSELADQYIAEQINRIGDNTQIIQNTPIKIANQDGFLIHYRYVMKNGISRDNLVGGFTANKYFYSIRLRGTTLHYFPSSVMEFKTMLKSIRIYEKT